MSKTKRFILKEAQFVNDVDVSVSLEGLLKKALGKIKNVEDRIFETGGRKYFINYKGIRQTKEFGRIYGIELLSFEEGADISILKKDSGEEEFDIAGMSPDENQEYVDGSLYAGIQENYLVITQSMALRIGQLESYLNWILQTKSEIIDEEQGVTLVDALSDRFKEELSGVKKIRLIAGLGAPRAQEKEDNDDDDKKILEQGIDVVSEKYKTMMSCIRFFAPDFGGVDKKDSLELDQLVDISKLKFEMVLSVDGHKISGGEDIPMLSDMARLFRNVDEDAPFDFVIEAPGKTITKKMIKKTKMLQLKWDDGRPDFNQIFDKMAESLETWITEIRQGI